MTEAYPRREVVQQEVALRKGPPPTKRGRVNYVCKRMAKIIKSADWREIVRGLRSDGLELDDVETYLQLLYLILLQEYEEGDRGGDEFVAMATKLVSEMRKVCQLKQARINAKIYHTPTVSTTISLPLPTDSESMGDILEVES